MSQALQIHETMEDDVHVLTLEGRLDTITASILDNVGRRIQSADRTAKIMVDLGQCTFISSAGLRVIITIQKRAMMGGSLMFRNAKPEVMDVFEATGFDGLLDID